MWHDRIFYDNREGQQMIMRSKIKGYSRVMKVFVNENELDKDSYKKSRLEEAKTWLELTCSEVASIAEKRDIGCIKPGSCFWIRRVRIKARLLVAACDDYDRRFSTTERITRRISPRLFLRVCTIEHLDLYVGIVTKAFVMRKYLLRRAIYI